MIQALSQRMIANSNTVTHQSTVDNAIINLANL